MCQGSVPLWRHSIILLPIVCLAMAMGTGLYTARADMQSDGRKAGRSEKLDGVRPYDEICGARCAEYVLDFFGKHVDVIELVREMQWPNIDRGATLQAVAESLEKRGVSTFPMKISSEARLKWPYPVIVHVAEENDQLGHFVVWLPTSSGSATQVWCGVDGTKEMCQADWIQQRSGAVLLTAPVAIYNPEEALERTGSIVSEYMPAAVIMTFVVAVGFIVSRAIRDGFVVLFH